MLKCSRIDRGIKIYNPEKDQTLIIDNYFGNCLRIIINSSNIKDSKRGFNYFVIKNEDLSIFESFNSIFEKFDMITYESDLEKTNKVNFVRYKGKIYIEVESKEMDSNELQEIQINSKCIRSNTSLNKYRKIYNCFYKLFMITKNNQFYEEENIKRLVKKRGVYEDE